MERKKTFCLGDFQVEPGEKKSGYILIGNGEFELPITVLNGEKSGNHNYKPVKIYLKEAGRL